MFVYVLCMITAFMLCLLVIVLLLHRCMKLLEQIAAVLAVLPPRTVQKPVATTEKGL